MKKVYLVIIFCWAFCSVFAQSHWHTVSSGTNSNLYCISFANEKTGFIGGEKGLLLQTTDSGNSWQELQPTGLNNAADIIDLQFIDAQHGYAILSHFPVAEFQGKLFQTADGGQTWIPANDSIPVAPSRCYFFKEGNGYLLGAAFFAGNVIGKMEQSLWTEYFYYSSNPSQFNYGIDFRDTLTGIVGGDGGNFYRTFDGGQSWDTVYSGKDSTIYAIKYLNDSAIIAATGHGNRSLIISYDKGATWSDEVNSFTFDYPIMKSLAVAAGDSIVAVGHTTNPTMSPAGTAYWFDGSNWQLQQFRQNLYDVAKQSAAAAFAVGDSGLIITNYPQIPSSIPGKSRISKNISIFPNPAKNTISLKYNNLHIQSLTLTDLSGRTVKNFPAESKTLNVSGVAAGLYFLQVKAREGEMVEKVEIR